MHYCKPKIHPILVWSKNPEFVERGKNYINTYFIEYLYAITSSDLSLVLEGIAEEEIESAIEQYDFHIIKLKDEHFELILVDNQRHRVEEVEDFELALEGLLSKIRED